MAMVFRKRERWGEGGGVTRFWPNYKSLVKGLVEGRVFDERQVEWELGEGLDQAIPRGLELAIEKLKVSHSLNIRNCIPRVWFQSPAPGF